MDLSAMIKSAIAIDERWGFITFDQLNELESEDIEILLTALSARGIDVREA